MAKYVAKITLAFEQDFIDDPSLRVTINEWLKNYFNPALRGMPIENVTLENVTLNKHGSPENILKRGNQTCFLLA
jgi:hypothetical protein